MFLDYIQHEFGHCEGLSTSVNAALKFHYNCELHKIPRSRFKSRRATLLKEGDYELNFQLYLKTTWLFIYRPSKVRSLFAMSVRNCETLLRIQLSCLCRGKQLNCGLRVREIFSVLLRCFQSIWQINSGTAGTNSKMTFKRERGNWLIERNDSFVKAFVPLKQRRNILLIFVMYII